MDFSRYRTWLVASATIFLVCVVILLAPPTTFSPGTFVVIERGTPVSSIAEELARTDVIKHPTMLRLLLRISGVSARVQSGTYLFERPQSALVVAYRLATGAYGVPPVRITFPEGVTTRDIAERVADAFPTISATDVIELGRPSEGYLFPDTYHFQADSNVDAIISAMRENFDVKIEPLLDEIRASGHSLADIVTMASLVEKEARTTENRKIVAGILWDRLALGMPLQVDAVFGYIFDRDTYSPSFADLKVDSPYNTYTHTGLPPGPIANPGLESIEAALRPTKTKYLYYLTDPDGVMRYATTYAEHQANERAYLH